MTARYGFICISLETNDAEHLFLGLFVTCTSSLMKSLCLPFAHFLTRRVVLLLLRFGGEGLLGVGCLDEEELSPQQAGSALRGREGNAPGNK